MATSTRTLKCNPNAISFPTDYPKITCPTTRAALETAADQLVQHLQPVVIPTETVYGLAASARSAEAVSRIFTTKGRPSDNPLIVHVSSFAMLSSILPPDFKIPRTYETLMKKFWPGPLTLLFPNNPEVIPSAVTANLQTVAIRMPSHPVARAIIALSNTPLAAPSANSSGKPSPTKAEHVAVDLNGKVDIILDGGPCGIGLESTVVDGLGEDGHLRVLRPGGVTVEAIEATLRGSGPQGEIPKVLVHGRDYRDGEIESTPTTPGMKYRHYSPSVPVTLLMVASSPPPSVVPLPYHEFLNQLRQSSARRTKIGLLLAEDSPYLTASHSSDLELVPYLLGRRGDLATVAQRLFDGLLTLERQGVDHILIEEVQSDNEGLAIMNRVKKAAGHIQWISA